MPSWPNSGDLLAYRSAASFGKEIDTIHSKYLHAPRHAPLISDYRSASRSFIQVPDDAWSAQCAHFRDFVGLECYCANRPGW